MEAQVPVWITQNPLEILVELLLIAGTAVSQ
jgi:hypothetical protein